MTFKKIHRRRDLLDRRAPTSTTTTGTPGQSYLGNIEPTGPPGGGSSTSSTVVSTSSVSSASSSSSTTSVSTSTTVPTTPPAASTSPRASVTNSPAQVTRSITTHVTVTSSTSSSTATSTAAADNSSMGLGSIAGIGVAAIVAIGVLTAFVIWLIRRRKKNSDIDEEPFNRNSFLRNSAAIPDDDDAPLPGTRARPQPAMSERTATPLYGQQNVQFAGNDPSFGYATQPSYGQPGGMYSPNPYGPGGAPATPLPHSPGYGTTYDQGYGAPGGYAELTRGGPHDYPPSPGFNGQMENPHSPSYMPEQGFPVPPPMAAGNHDSMHGSIHSGMHDAGVVRSMTPVGQGQVVSVDHSTHDGRETPVQLGFAPGQMQQGQQAQRGYAPQGQQGRQQGHRPDTVYDTDDAYGGI